MQYRNDIKKKDFEKYIFLPTSSIKDLDPAVPLPLPPPAQFET